MLLASAQSHDLGLASSWMIGSSGIDVEAGKNASFKTVRIVQKDVVEDNAAGLSAQSLLAAVHHLLALQP
jgi:histidinol phosphatase-like enzyme